MSFFLFLFILFIIFLDKIESSEKLVFVMTHFRHGARAPQNYYTDHLDYIKQSWTNPGELTGLGQRMHYLLGLRNRIRYIDEKKFLSEAFNPHEILIYSSPFNRTINSVNSQLQGLYPQSIKKGEIIRDDQEPYSRPQVKINYTKIDEEKEKLGNYALPNSMIIAPVRMINNNERKITIYDIEPCTIKRDEIKKKNSETLESLINIVKNFTERYGEKLDNFYGKKENYNNISFLDNFCDAFIAGYTDRRNLDELKSADLNIDELRDYCYEFQKLNFRDWIAGDDKHVLAHVEVSKLMKEFIHYMLERVDADIRKDDIDSKYEDYSRPKMMMVSAHDSTVSMNEIVLMEAFGENKDFYKLPKFATQIAFEITTDDSKESRTRDDYYINYYFNDDLIFTKKIQEFIDKVTPHIWTDKQIDDFCGFQRTKDEYSTHTTLLILFISLTVIFFTSTLILSIKLVKDKKSENANKIPLLPKNTE